MVPTAGRLSRTVTTWVPLSIALASFVVSMYTFSLTLRAPHLEIVLPQQIRLAQGAEFGYAYAYLQPTFVHAGPSAQVEVIQAMRLEVEADAGENGPGATLEWRESGRIAYDPATQGASYVYEVDAAPLLLSRETAHSPLGTFYGPPGWYFTPGRWRATLIAERAGDRAPLTASFAFTLSADVVETLTLSGGTIFLPIAIDPVP